MNRHAHRPALAGLIFRLLAAASIVLALSPLVSSSGASAVTPLLPHQWEAESDPAIGHQIGRAVGDGWQATTADCPNSVNCAMAYGPNIIGITGAVTFTGRLKIDDAHSDSRQVAVVDLVETLNSQSTAIATSAVFRGSFPADDTYTPISMTVMTRPDAYYQMRVFHLGIGTLTLDYIRANRDPGSGLFWTYQAENDPAIRHDTGRATADGWSGTPLLDAAGYLQYGPYATDLDDTSRVVFRLKTITQANLPDAQIATIEAYSNRRVLATRPVWRRDFLRSDTYQDFGLNAVLTPGQPVEFRVNWLGTAPLTIDQTQLFHGTTFQSVDAAASTTQHATGTPVTEAGGNAWQTGPADPAGLMSYSPSSGQLYGEANAAFQLRLDDSTSAPSVVVAHVGVLDGNQHELAGRDLRAGDFRYPNMYQDFRLRYRAPAGALASLAVSWPGASAGQVHLTLKRFRAEDRVLPGRPRLTDVWDRRARWQVNGSDNPPEQPNGTAIQVPSIVSDGTMYYAYYYLPGTGGGNGNDRTGLAISSDGGRTFVPYDGGVPVVSLGANGDFDFQTVAFADVIRVDDHFVMVYEAHSRPIGTGDEVSTGWATSTDGIHWDKHGKAVPHGTLGTWDQDAAGSPSVNYYDGTYYVWFHGCRLDLQTCGRGFASGTSMSTLAKNSTNPVLPGSGSGWDDKVVGRAGVRYDGSAYYMVFEGSNDPNCDTQAQWGIGLARTPDLVTWTRWTSTDPSAQKNPFRYEDAKGPGCDYAGPTLTTIGGRSAVLWFKSGVGSVSDVIEGAALDPAPPTTATAPGPGPISRPRCRSGRLCPGPGDPGGRT